MNDFVSLFCLIAFLKPKLSLIEADTPLKPCASGFVAE